MRKPFNLFWRLIKRKSTTEFTGAQSVDVFSVYSVNSVVFSNQNIINKP